MGVLKWTVGMDETLVRLWHEERPVREIAAALRVTPGAVKGRRGKIGLPKRPPGGHSFRPRQPAVNVVTFIANLPPTAKPHEPTGCRWIEGDPIAGPWRYCQAPTRDGSPYCDHHHGRCYVRVQADALEAAE